MKKIGGITSKDMDTIEKIFKKANPLMKICLVKGIVEHFL